MNEPTISLDYSEHSKYCGGIFSFHRLEPGPDRFRIYVAIENTGEHGILTLLLESSRVIVFDSKHADEWVRTYAWFRAQRLTCADRYENNDTVISLHPLATTDLPIDLAPGTTWEGWFESSRPLPDGTVALFVQIGLLRQEVPRRYWSFITFDRNRPFVSLTGEVLAPPLSPPRWLLAKAKFLLRISHPVAFFGAAIGTFVCMGLADLLLGLPLLGAPAGIAIGVWAHNLSKGRTQLPRFKA